MFRVSCCFILISKWRLFVLQFSTTLSKCSITGLQGLIQGPKDWG